MSGTGPTRASLSLIAHYVKAWSGGISIRQLLLLVLGLLSLIAVFSVALNAVSVIQQYNQAARLGVENQLANRTLRVTVELAIERGLTATLLATGNRISPAALQQLNAQRLRSDRESQQFLSLLQRLGDHAATLAQSNSLASFHQLQAELEGLRNQVDRTLITPDNSRLRQRWMDRLTHQIGVIADIPRLFQVSANESERAIRYGSLLKESFFTLSEYAGLERATIAQVIAQQRPFSAGDLLRLERYRDIMAVSEKQIDSVLRFYPRSRGIKTALERMDSEYHGRYEKLRQSLLLSSRSENDYPIGPLEWFSEATRSIDSILSLSQAVSLDHDSGIRSIQKSANQAALRLLISALLIGILFFGACVIIYRRILHPLRRLEQAADTIGDGNLQQPIHIVLDDEFGSLEKRLETMRANLLFDREQREKVEQELQKLHQAVEQSVSAIIITDGNGLAEYVNHRFELTSGYQQGRIIGSAMKFTRPGEAEPQTCREIWDAERVAGVWEGELLNQKQDGEYYWVLASISPVKNRQGEVSHYISVQHDITERKALEKQLNYLAYHDALTGLPNRALLADRFDQVIGRSRRCGCLVAVLMLDLDRFKVINDSLGHHTGDEVLLEVAKRLHAIARESDTVCRYGGDEFVILLPDIGHPAGVSDVARRITESIAERIRLKERELYISCSIGATLWPQDGKTLDSLLSHADAAMYQAKGQGGEHFSFFTTALNEQVQLRMALENDLRQSIELKQMEVYYQPQVDIDSGTIIGMEALLRWHHPERGLISPDSFISLAEETGSILAIGEWVLEQACILARSLQIGGYPELVVAVNVSVRQFEDQDIAAIISSALARSGLPPANLEIEVTESTMMKAPEAMIGTLAALKRLGIRLSLDDFGTGYSSLVYLQRFPFDKLKIDRAFIVDVNSSANHATMTHTISTMAKSLNMGVIAEGVETGDQLAFLKQCGCKEAQGYLFSRPVTSGQFAELLPKYNPMTPALP